MNKFFSLTLMAFLVVACKTPALVPGVPTLKNPKEVVAKVYEYSSNDRQIAIRATGRYEIAGDKQGFKANIRIIRDSIIWIELSDPLLGIKVGRGIIMKDSIAFINKIEGTYMAGSMADFSAKLETHLEFNIIQNLLLGEPMRTINPKEKMQLELLEKIYALYYFPKSDALFKFTQPNYYFEIEPTNFRIKKQEAIDGGHKISASYGNYKMVGNKLYPSQLNITLAFENNITLQLQYATIRAVEELRIPFKISSKYKRINLN